MGTEIASWLFWITTDPQVTGVLTIISIFVTLGGFGIAWQQLRKVRGAAEAARVSSERLTKVVRSREQNARLSWALLQLRSAQYHLSSGNVQAANAYIETSCTSLAEAKHLSDVQSEQKILSNHLIKLRKITEEIAAQSASGKVDKAPSFRPIILKALEDIEGFTIVHRWAPTDGEQL